GADFALTNVATLGVVKADLIARPRRNLAALRHGVRHGDRPDRHAAGRARLLQTKRKAQWLRTRLVETDRHQGSLLVGGALDALHARFILGERLDLLDPLRRQWHKNAPDCGFAAEGA